MSDPADQQAEIQALREQIEGYRQRELEDLRSQLAEARTQAAHYRAEAERNANLGHEIAREAEAERARLRERISVLEQSHDTRPKRPATG